MAPRCPPEWSARPACLHRASCAPPASLRRKAAQSGQGCGRTRLGTRQWVHSGGLRTERRPSRPARRRRVGIALRRPRFGGGSRRPRRERVSRGAAKSIPFDSVRSPPRPSPPLPRGCRIFAPGRVWERNPPLVRGEPRSSVARAPSGARPSRRPLARVASGFRARGFAPRPRLVLRRGQARRSISGAHSTTCNH